MKANLPWPHKWFGIFRGPDDTDLRFPLIRDFQDESWHPHDLLELITYLNNARCVVAVQGEPHKCDLCDQELPLGAYRYDGQWLWPVQLSHDVSVHNVRLPESLVLRIREKQYVPPVDFDVSFEQLPWPG